MSAQNAIDLLQSIRRGQLLDDLYEACREAIEAEQKQGRKATVTLTIEFKPATKSDIAPMEVYAAIRTRLPQADPAPQFLYATNDERLVSTRDPRQPDMFEPRVVEGADEERPQSAERAGGAS